MTVFTAILSAAFADEPVPPPPAVVTTQEVEDRVALAREGFVSEPIGGGSGVLLSTAAVVGGDGGTTAVTARGRLAIGKSFVLAVGVPFASWRNPAGRDAGLGNLSVGAWIAPNDNNVLGVVAHAPLGRAYTWVNEAEELWPGTGLEVVWRSNKAVEGTPLTLLGRLSAGAHTSGGYDPVPGLFLKTGVAGAADLAFDEHLGVVLEGSAAYWDTSPFDLAALVRGEVQGFRARAGLVLPLASWSGLQPAPVVPGIREATLRADLCAQW